MVDKLCKGCYTVYIRLIKKRLIVYEFKEKEFMNMCNDLYVTVSPNAIKAVNQGLTQYSSQGNNESLFVGFWDWFNTEWSVKSPDAIIHIMKQA